MPAARSLIRIAVNVAIDGVLAAVAVPVAWWITDPAGAVPSAGFTVLLGAAALLLGGVPFRLSQQYWRFAGMGDLLTVAASSVSGAALFSLALYASALGPPSAAFPLAHGLTLLALLGAPRVAYRWFRSRGQAPMARADATSVLVVGQTEDCDLFLRALTRDRRQRFRVEGLITLGDRQTGRRIQGYPILGAMKDAGTVLERLRDEGRLPGTLVMATPDLQGGALASVVAQADRFGLRVRRAPRLTELHHGTEPGEPRPVELRPIMIEDLLNRPQVPLDRDGMARLIQGRRVIVTGAGGTIGSELARQVASFGPGILVLIDNGEFALWQIDMELAETFPNVRRQSLIADIRDEARIRSVFEQVQPDLVFHAAALKHVPIVEDNPLEGLMTNAAGTRHVADAARASGALAMVLISTDKAVNPTSVMGASKRLAEMYCQALDIVARKAGPGAPASGMRCITVRFGNVLGSTGSVVPLFQRQLARGGPLTVTHPDMRRYFMTVREAVGLVLQANVLGVGEARPPLAEDGGIFVLDMGEPVKIVDLARQMIRLAGLKPDEDVEIRFTGLRPGEKLFEELFHGKEPPAPTGHPGLLMAHPRTADPAIVGRAIEEIATACRGNQSRLALMLLSRLIPEFERGPEAAQADARAGTGA
jgi:FlaA1/EpsC-like NDP-sugar epimerase